MGKIRSVLFICTGNSCRSVMAEGLMKKYLKEMGRADIEVRSAGILPGGGLIPTPETVMVMKEEGVDVAAYRSKPLTADLIRGADLILVMENIHKEEVLRLDPEAGPRTYLLKEYGILPKENHMRLSIPDPIGKPLEYYKGSLAVIKKEIERIAKTL